MCAHSISLKKIPLEKLHGRCTRKTIRGGALMKIKLNTNNIFFLKKGGWLCRLSFDTIKTTDLAKKKSRCCFHACQLREENLLFP
jgi:hypothetical protein